MRAFGEGERALRLVPLLAGLGSLWLFFLVARRWLSPTETLLALAHFALAQPLVYYAAEVKQYSTDVFVALALLWAAGFPPVPPRSLADLLWPVRTFFGFFVDPAGLGLAGLAAAAFVIGCVRWWRSDRGVLALLVSPGLFTLLAALLHRYPFPTSASLDSYPLPGRVVLFLVPAAMILVAAGVGWMARTLDRDPRLIAGVMAAFLLLWLGGGALRRPAHRIRLHELRPLVEALARDGRPDDLLILNTRAIPLFRYYLRRLEGDAGFVRGLPVVELPGTNRWNAYERQMRALPEGARVWVLYAHHPSWRSQQDEAFVLHVLARRGQLDRETIAPGASLHLFRIGGPAGARS